jgi:hypothetical protein
MPAYAYKFGLTHCVKGPLNGVATFEQIQRTYIIHYHVAERTRWMVSRTLQVLLAITASHFRPTRIVLVLLMS